MNTRFLLMIALLGLLSGCTAYVPGHAAIAYDSGSYYDGYGAVSVRQPVYVDPRPVIRGPVYPPVAHFAVPFERYPRHHGHHEHHSEHWGGHGDFRGYGGGRHRHGH